MSGPSLPPSSPQPQASSSSSIPPTPSSQQRPTSTIPPNILKALSRSPEKQYTGPSRSSLPPPRSKFEAERYFAKLGGGVQGETILPTRGSKMLGVGAWVLGGFACIYMGLYVDFGEREHVFSPMRRGFQHLKSRFFTLSPNERRIMGLHSDLERQAMEEGSLRSSTDVDQPQRPS
ncbi:hypothetical protein IAU59_003358 [Kwoniella sp. CBS 9459]